MKMTERMRMRTRQQMCFVLIATGVFVAGCGGGSGTTSQKIEVVQGLHVQRTQLQNVADELEAPGSVIAVSTAQVAARTMARYCRWRPAKATP